MNIRCITISLLASGLQVTALSQVVYPKNPADSIIKVIHCSDFRLAGDGSEPEWNGAEWHVIRQTGSPVRYGTRMKIMYSDSGIYCLYHCEDKIIKSTLKGDFLDLWHEDVVEAFFWTDERLPIYFEYELSPANYELPILVPNNDGNFLGWRPWHYEGKRMTRHLTGLHYDKTDPGKLIAWTAEFYIPYALLKPIVGNPPVKGIHWRANFYRIDYDNGPAEWCWLAVPGTFHDYRRFGTLLFE